MHFRIEVQIEVMLMSLIIAAITTTAIPKKPSMSVKIDGTRQTMFPLMKMQPRLIPQNSHLTRYQTQKT